MPVAVPGRGRRRLGHPDQPHRPGRPPPHPRRRRLGRPADHRAARQRLPVRRCRGARVDLGVGSHGGTGGADRRRLGPGDPRGPPRPGLRPLPPGRRHRRAGPGWAWPSPTPWSGTAAGTWSVGTSPLGGARMEVSWRQAPRAAPPPGPPQPVPLTGRPVSYARLTWDFLPKFLYLTSSESSGCAPYPGTMSSPRAGRGATTGPDHARPPAGATPPSSGPGPSPRPSPWPRWPPWPSSGSTSAGPSRVTPPPRPARRPSPHQQRDRRAAASSGQPVRRPTWPRPARPRSSSQQQQAPGRQRLELTVGTAVARGPATLAVHRTTRWSTTVELVVTDPRAVAGGHRHPRPPAGPGRGGGQPLPPRLGDQRAARGRGPRARPGPPGLRRPVRRGEPGPAGRCADRRRRRPHRGLGPLRPRLRPRLLRPGRRGARPAARGRGRCPGWQTVVVDTERRAVGTAARARCSTSGPRPRPGPPTGPAPPSPTSWGAAPWSRWAATSPCANAPDGGFASGHRRRLR